MSFILDALKKSEADRQRRNAPGISSIPEADGRKRHSGWIWIISALLTLNLAVLLGFVLRSGGNSEQPAVPLDLPATQAAPAPAPETFSEIVTEAKRTVPRVEATKPPSEATTPPGEREPVRNVAPPQTNTAALPSFNDIRARGTVQLPDMHLDIHVFSGEAADRFVFVNMSKYREGTTLAEGPLVREITPDGVVLEYGGNLFLLPRE